MGKKSTITPERAIHEKAVKIRKMTDSELCDYISDLRATSFGAGYAQGKEEQALKYAEVKDE